MIFTEGAAGHTAGTRQRRHVDPRPSGGQTLECREGGALHPTPELRVRLREIMGREGGAGEVHYSPEIFIPSRGEYKSWVSGQGQGGGLPP